jgi:Mlc titration factor MtfA (ptsG expression regulator)
LEVFPRRRIYGRLELTALACLFFSSPFIYYGKALFVVPVLFGIGAVYYLGMFLPRYLRRRRIAEAPLSEADRALLERHVSFYAGLSPDDRKTYETDIAIFLAEHRIEGVDDVAISREVELLVAATAVRLIFRRPDWEYRDFGTILVYPGGFRNDGSYSTDISGDEPVAVGLVHSAGNVILSLPHLLAGFRADNDGLNVGYHEFAHVLDGFRPDGVPAELSLGAYRPWVEVMQREFEKVHKGRSVLRSYAGTDPAEFFACAVEAFFEQPAKVLEKAPDLYRELSGFFNQRP